MTECSRADGADVSVAMEFLLVVISDGEEVSGCRCPAEWLNGKCYVGDWLENLLASSSMNDLLLHQ
jgi:hypothetical protein